MQYTILVVEDDADISKLLTQIMETAGYKTKQAFSGTEAKLLLEKEMPDLILLDLMIPGMTGDKLLHEIRENKSCNVPILILSAKSSLKNKVTLLNMGADDYITKPFEPEEVLARIRAALRHTGKTADNGQVLSHKKMKLYPESRKVIVNQMELVLTAYEYELLHLLIQTPEKVYSRENLYELVWKGGYYGENNTVNVHVSNLRKKIKEADPTEEYIQTVYGIGFKLG